MMNHLFSEPPKTRVTFYLELLHWYSQVFFPLLLLLRGSPIYNSWIHYSSVLSLYPALSRSFSSKSAYTNCRLEFLLRDSTWRSSFSLGLQQHQVMETTNLHYLQIMTRCTGRSLLKVQWKVKQLIPRTGSLDQENNTTKVRFLLVQDSGGAFHSHLEQFTMTWDWEKRIRVALVIIAVLHLRAVIFSLIWLITESGRLLNTNLLHF